MALTNKTKLPEKFMPEAGVEEEPIEQAPEAETGIEKEALPEQAGEKPELEKKQEQAAPSAATTAPVSEAEVKEKPQDLVDIEKILSEGLEDMYKELPENRRNEFKQAGEETAGKIQVMLKSAKVKVKKVIDLIKNWLKMIPGVNKHFLEKEAKIKADKLMHMRDENNQSPNSNHQ